MLKESGTNYYQGSFPAERITDEVMIANMLNLLNNPVLSKMLDDNELKTVLQVVKNHVVTKADFALRRQEKYEIEQEYGSIGRQFR